MIATRGNTKDHWVEMGNEDWAYLIRMSTEHKDVHFKKLETIDISELKSNTAYHGTNESVTRSKFHTGVAKAFIQASKEMEYPIVDYNEKEEIGFSYVQTTIINGTHEQQQSVSKSYAR